MNKLELINKIQRIKDGIKDFCDIAVVGMSGGADSTLVTTLCAQALGPENVHTVHMPYSQTDIKTFNDRSFNTAERLGVEAQMVLIGGISEAINAAVFACSPEGYEAEEIILSQVNMGNARSRARMCVLYGVCSHINEQEARAHLYESSPSPRVRVIGTGNLSEDYIGYDTKGGDALADLFPIGELFKSEVYAMLEYFVDEGILEEEDIDRNPSAGLWEGQTDEAELGYSYNEMEPAIRLLRENGDELLDIMVGLSTREQKIILFVHGRHHANNHKHRAPPTIDLRPRLAPEV